MNTSFEQARVLFQGQLDAAPPGGVVDLEPREFPGPVTVRRPLTLDGHGATLWASQGPVLTVAAPHVVLRNLRIEVTGTATNRPEDACALLVRAGGLHLENVESHGTVLGLPGEEGEWHPRALDLGELEADREHEFLLRLDVPVACRLTSTICGLEVEPGDLLPGVREVRLRVERLPADTLLRGNLYLASARLRRRIVVEARVTENGSPGAAAGGTLPVIWQPTAIPTPVPWPGERTSRPAGRLVGIDLGTTFSVIATLDEHGRALTLPNRDGENLTPSVILIEDGQAVVGQAAADAALEQPGNVAALVKRRMGYASHGQLLAGREFRPETLAAIILRKLVNDAAGRIGPIDRVVITVPAYFDDTRRKATKDAARIAGLDVLDLLDEPTAAALAYSFQPRPGEALRPDEALPAGQQTVLVYDLGGGTFDVTLVRLSRRRFETLAIEGDFRLGGKDWDERIVDHVAGLFRRQHGDDPRGDPVSLAALQAAAERAKRNLSVRGQTTVRCSHNGKVLTVTLTRAEFEALTRDLLLRTRLTTQQALRDAGLAWDRVDHALLVGGSTHMPMCGQMLQEISGRAPNSALTVSEVVARGAALHAGIVASARPEDGLPLDADVRADLGRVVEVNVNSHSLGVEVRQQQQRRNDVLIPRNTPLPAAVSRVYRTRVDNQQRVRVRVLQGDAPQPDACIPIGECWIEDLPPHLPRGSPIQVRCVIASNGLIEVAALDMTSGKLAHTTLHRDTGLTEDEIAREAAWLRGLRIL
jgi:molecular chaperone DnaK